MHDKFSGQIETALERLAARIARSKKRLDPAKVNRQIGRILQQNQRAAARFDRAGAGRLPGGFPPYRRLQRLIRRLGRALGRRLSSAFEHRRLDRSATLEGLYPAHPGRGRVPHSERSAQPPSDLASARRPRSGSYPRLLSCLRAVEDPRCWQQRAGLGNSPRTILKELARESSRMTWSCRSPPMLNPLALRHSTRRRTSRSSTASASSSPNACASPNTGRRSSPPPPEYANSPEM